MVEQHQPDWFKSSYSNAPNNECVECANLPQGVLVRDSKEHDGTHFSFSHEAWADFTEAVRTSTLPRH
ncbi:DUF397 domain-containing protein [Streptomyces turgidiscabies]|uniref:DUF397 domain-containing protein n=1 Tax=Streptomyces turgidiscabies TaxID=85558 RepID=UPI0038F6C6C0